MYELHRYCFAVKFSPEGRIFFSLALEITAPDCYYNYSQFPRAQHRPVLGGGTPNGLKPA